MRAEIVSLLRFIFNFVYFLFLLSVYISVYDCIFVIIVVHQLSYALLFSYHFDTFLFIAT